jgi:molecular chaperone DnaK (HSP70)
MTMTPPPNDAVVDSLFQPTTHHTEEEGIWVGIDFGTSNSACAVWDSANGRAKWIRLPPTLAATQSNGKKGRIMPSVVLFGQGDNVSNILKVKQSATVGQGAVNMMDSSLQDTDDAHESFSQVSDALVYSVKRIFGMKHAQLKENKELLESLPFSVEYDNDEKGSDRVYLKIRPLHSNQDMLMTPLEVTSIILQSLRLAIERYLDIEGLKKQLDVPGSGKVRNCVVGVPAQFGQAQRKLMEQACRLAGFDGTVSTITESTAASMAYGLFSSTSRVKTILVFDMGGGTTDLTICQETEDAAFHVVVSQGDDCLGGDDMDHALLDLVVNKYTKEQAESKIKSQERRNLLRLCRKGKEELCGNAYDGQGPAESCKVKITNDVFVTVSWQEFNDAIQPLIQRAQNLVLLALERYQDTYSSSSIDEVVLVGGATRVPEVRSMLQETFPHVELCTSVSADSAVAQGAAIQAALLSSLVPLHELRSALMLDALPHSIGVKMDDGRFLSILEKDSPLPAMGYASFTLADVHQPGVTIVAVENVGNDLPCEKIGEFSFLLRKLTEEQLASLHNKRRVDIGMTMETDGKFIVSIFDPNDPEHLAKRRRYLKNKAATRGNDIKLDYHERTTGITSDDNGITWTKEESKLLILPILLFIAYVVLKLAFHEVEAESGDHY